ncbi:hypothetical protein [Streptomyces sp. NPDC049949]
MDQSSGALGVTVGNLRRGPERFVHGGEPALAASLAVRRLLR